MSMKELRKWASKLARWEPADANESKPLFASDHEGLAIIEEEVWEARNAMETIELWMDELKENVFMDDPYEEKRDSIDCIEKKALDGACELIQVAAMCQKFRVSHKEVKEEFPQEHADALTELNLTKEEKDKFACEIPSFAKTPKGELEVVLSPSKLTIMHKREEKDKTTWEKLEKILKEED